MSKTLTGGAAAALLLSGLLIAGAPAQVAGQAQTGATKYDFTTLLDSRKDRVRATRCAAINSLGTVAVTVQDLESGVTRMVTKGTPDRRSGRGGGHRVGCGFSDVLRQRVRESSIGPIHQRHG